MFWWSPHQTHIYPSSAPLFWPGLIFLFAPLSVSQLNRSNALLSCGFVYSSSDPRPARDAQALQLFFHIWHFFICITAFASLPSLLMTPPALFAPEKFCPADNQVFSRRLNVIHQPSFCFFSLAAPVESSSVIALLMTSFITFMKCFFLFFLNSHTHTHTQGRW